MKRQMGAPLIFFLISSLYLPPLVQAQSGNSPCQSAWRDREAAVEDIARLMLERDEAIGVSAPAMRAILIRDVEIKLAEFKLRYGVSLGREEIDRAITAQRRLRETAGQQQRESTERQRAIEVKKALPLVEQLEIDFKSKLKDLDLVKAMEPDVGSLMPEGLQWTGDERFLLARSVGYLGPNETQLYDFLTGQVYERFGGTSLATGLLNPPISHYLSNSEPDQTRVHDLISGQEWGPFSGRPSQKHLNPNVLIARRIVSRDFHLHDYLMSGRSLLLGKIFGHSADYSRVMYAEDENTLVLFDVKTWKAIRTLHFEGGVKIFSGGEGHLVYSDQGQFRLHLIDEDAGYPLEVSKLFALSLSADHQTVVMDIDSGKIKIVKLGTGESLDINAFWYRVDRHRPLAMFRSIPGLTGTRLVDLNTLKTRDLQLMAEDFALSGEALVSRLISVEEDTTRIVDLEGREDRSWSFEGDLDYFSPNSSFAIHHDHDVDTQKFVISQTAQHVGSALGEIDEFPIGEYSVLVSPLGKYVATYRGDKLVVYRNPGVP